MTFLAQAVKHSNKADNSLAKRQKQSAKSVNSKPANKEAGMPDGDNAPKAKLKGKAKSSSSTAKISKRGKAAETVEPPVRVTRSRASSQPTH